MNIFIEMLLICIQNEKYQNENSVTRKYGTNCKYNVMAEIYPFAST